MIPPPAQEYLDLLAACGPEVTGLALGLRAMVLEEAPGAFDVEYEAYKAVATGFSFTGKSAQTFIHIAAFRNCVNLGFNKGGDLPDPGRILRGDGPALRHIRISSQADIERSFIRKFIQEAVRRAVRPHAVVLTRTATEKKKGPTGGAPGNRGAGSKRA
jgi:hypothetical protein